MKKLTTRHWVAILISFAIFVSILIFFKVGPGAEIAEWVKKIYKWYQAYEFITSCSK